MPNQRSKIYQKLKKQFPHLVLPRWNVTGSTTAVYEQLFHKNTQEKKRKQNLKSYKRIVKKTEEINKKDLEEKKEFERQQIREMEKKREEMSKKSANIDIYLFINSYSSGDRIRMLMTNYNKCTNHRHYENDTEKFVLTKTHISPPDDNDCGYNVIRHVPKAYVQLGQVDTDEKMYNYINDKYRNIYGFGEITEIAVQLESVTGNVLEWIDMPLLGGIKHLCQFANVISADVDDGKCVYNYVMKSDILKKYKSELKGNTVKLFMEFLEYVKTKHTFTYGIFDYDGNLRFGSLEADINVICSHNHISVIDGKNLKNTKKEKDIVAVEKYESMYSEFVKLLKDGIIPYNVVANNKKINIVDSLDPNKIIVKERLDISMYETSKDTYVCNKFYSEMKELLETLHISISKLPYTIECETGIIPSLEKYYCHANILSYCFPYDYQTYIPKYRCNNRKLEELKTNAIGIDCIGAYRNVLYNLKYLLSFDIITNKIIAFDGTLKDNYIYKVKFISYEGKTPNILMRDIGLYEKDYLERCALYGFKYEIQEQIECNFNLNYYNPYIEDIMSLPDKFNKKLIINMTIGKFNKSIGDVEQVFDKYSHVVTSDEAERIDNKLVLDVNEEYKLIRTRTMDRINTINKKPIYMQITNKHNMNLYETMKELNVTYDNLIQLKTDNILFSTSNKNIVIEYANTHNYRLEAPKLFENEIFIERFATCNNIINNKKVYSTLQSVFAGVGKTTLLNKCINEPTDENVKYLLKNADTTIITTVKNALIKGDYTVLCPTHVAALKFNKNCDVITHYIKKNLLPNSSVIIIDEIGMITTAATYRYLMSCNLAGKIIICLGDFTQVRPIDGFVELTEDIKNMIFMDTDTNLDKNYRNNFTKEYYKKIIYEMTQKEAVDEMVKYNTKTCYDAETIITYRNVTRNMYNDKVLRHNYKLGPDAKYRCIHGCKNSAIIGHTYTFEEVQTISENNNKNIWELFRLEYRCSGMPYLCLTNEFQHEKYKVVNGTTLIYDKIVNGYVHFKDTNFIVKENKFNNAYNFDLGYAMTDYKTQSKTVSSYYVAPEDLDIFERLPDCNNHCYMIISRLGTN